MTTSPGTARPQPLRVLVADADASRWGWLRDAVQGLGEVVVVPECERLLAELAPQAQGHDGGPYIVVVGEACRDRARAQLLADLSERREQLGSDSVAVFLAVSDAQTDARLPDKLPDELPETLSIQFVLHRGLSAEHIRALIARAHQDPRRAEQGPEDRASAAMLTRILDAARTVTSLDSLARVTAELEDAALEVTGAERAHCLFHDAEQYTLWSEAEGDPRADEVGAFRGLSGFAARVGEPVHAARADADPRYHRAIDDPDGRGDESVLAQPILDGDGQSHAVLVAVRSQTPFSATERARLAELAGHVATGIHQLALRHEAESVLDAGHDQLFRREAIDAYVSRGHSGDVVRVSPPWVRWAYWLLLVLLATGAVYLLVGRVDEYSVGPSVVRMTGRSDITAHVSGKIIAVEVTAGERVATDQVLVRLYSAAEAAELDRLRRELHAQIRARMFNPADPVARREVTSLHAQVRRAEARLEERTIRAPTAGTVADIRVRSSQHIDVGDPIASLVADDTELTVIALLPGADRPKLRPGMALRLELIGYRYAYQDLIIDKVSDEIIGPAEARRFLGKRLGDSVPVVGSVVRVEARLPAREFEAHGQRYPYYDGMLGRAEVRTRARRIIVALIPPLEEL